LLPYANDKQFQEQFIQIKQENKAKLASWVKEKTGYDIPINALYDI
jgi:starch phosphorylase